MVSALMEWLLSVAIANRVTKGEVAALVWKLYFFSLPRHLRCTLFSYLFYNYFDLIYIYFVSFFAVQISMNVETLLLA
jgi:hypothetical protein